MKTLKKKSGKMFKVPHSRRQSSPHSQSGQSEVPQICSLLPRSESHQY